MHILCGLPKNCQDLNKKEAIAKVCRYEEDPWFVLRCTTQAIGLSWVHDDLHITALQETPAGIDFFDGDVIAEI